MKNETEPPLDDLVQQIGALAADMKALAREAERRYAVIVQDILDRDAQGIERCLDGMLDFCFDDGMLRLYKKLCRYYVDIDPRATAFYIDAYRQMWDETDVLP